MKKGSGGTRTTKSISITVPKELLPLIKEEARRQGRNVSSFLVWLVRKDVGKSFIAKLQQVLSDRIE